MDVGQTQQPVGHFDVFRVEFALITKSRFADGKGLACHPYADTALTHSLLYWPSPVCEMASPLFFERLRHDLGPELFLKVHLLQEPVLVIELLHARHHRHVHAAVLGTPLVERRRAHTQLSANIG